VKPSYFRIPEITKTRGLRCRGRLRLVCEKVAMQRVGAQILLALSELVATLCDKMELVCLSMTT